ncbi:MAG: GlsB/YeaQ/YmgE family stress response membrane protein [Bacteroidaceae bacterium]|nr:GlsB/YeaQ/YmgE family stress response membrane protein [Bacteroidaceae bacterium]
MVTGLITGLIAGLIAGWIMRGQGYGCLLNIVLGLIGGSVGGWLFEKLGISWDGPWGSIGTAVVGAVVVIWAYQFISCKRK